MGLNDDLYSQVRGQILAQDPLPPLNNILNIVLQEKGHKKMMVQRDNKPKIVATFATNASKATQFQAGRPTCNHCEKTGHEEANYFELVGYLAG